MLRPTRRCAPALVGLPADVEAIFLDCTSNADFDDRSTPCCRKTLRAFRRATDPDTTCLMIYTSGTTGQPKGAELTHGNLTASLTSLQAAWGWQNNDVSCACCRSSTFTAASCAFHCALNASATTVMHKRFDPAQALATLVQQGRARSSWACPPSTGGWWIQPPPTR